YVVYSSSQILLDFFNEVLQENWDNALEQREKIKEFTHQAREMQQIAGQQLTKDRFAPVKRSEILRLLQLQTQIANKAQAITGLVIGRQLYLPPSLAIEYFPMLNKSIEAVYQSYILVNHLEDLAKPNQKSKFVEYLQNMIIELDRLENETDQLQIQARNVLLSLEHELYPVDVLTLYTMLDWTGDLADRAHELGGRFVSLLAS
ncbi:MAG: DUF47 domain-containing protein, partial [Gammaproteobacteria bacterium]